MIHKFNRCWEIKNKNTILKFVSSVILNCTISENGNDNYDNNNDDAGIWQVLNAYHAVYLSLTTILKVCILLPVHGWSKYGYGKKVNYFWGMSELQN